MTMPEPTVSPASVELSTPIKYGSFNNRMLASTLDVCVLLTFALPAVDFLMAQLFFPVNMDPLMAIFGSSSFKEDPVSAMPVLWQAVKEQHLIERIILENLLQIAFIALYILPFWMRYSTTPGKMLFRMIIVDEKTHTPMSDGQAIARFFGYFVSGLFFSLGFIWILFDKKKRGFHDKIAGTIVVVKPKKKQIVPVN